MSASSYTYAYKMAAINSDASVNAHLCQNFTAQHQIDALRRAHYYPIMFGIVFL